MNIAFFEPLNRAWERMKHILFQPFDLAKWLVLGFSAWLAGLADGAGGGDDVAPGNLLDGNHVRSAENLEIDGFAGLLGEIAQIGERNPMDIGVAKHQLAENDEQNGHDDERPCDRQAVRPEDAFSGVHWDDPLGMEEEVRLHGRRFHLSGRPDRPQ